MKTALAESFLIKLQACKPALYATKEGLYNRGL